jgi:hypothetical protein
VDQDGRSYDIHHIDGDRTNNSILNLVALSIQDHFDVHYIQGDWRACTKIAQKMKLSHEEISMLVSKQQKERIANGTHNWVGGEKQKKHQRELVASGRHHFLNSEVQSKINYLKVKNGTNSWAGQKGSEQSKAVQAKRIAEGTHHFLGKNNPVYKQIEEGRHPLALYAKNQKKQTCPKCHKTMNIGNYVKWNHGEKCEG